MRAPSWQFSNDPSRAAQAAHRRVQLAKPIVRMHQLYQALFQGPFHPIAISFCSSVAAEPRWLGTPNAWR